MRGLTGVGGGAVRWKPSADDLVLVTLTLGSGGVDALCFSGLGQVLTSVMTGNLVLVGLAAGHGDGLAVLRVCIAMAGFMVAAFTATRWLPRPARESRWPGRAAASLGVEFGLLAVGVILWITAGAHPTGLTRYLLILVYGFAMGTQSATIYSLGIPGMSTTYITGTLTWVAANLAHRSIDGATAGRRLRVVASVAVGAGCSSVLLRFVPIVAPLFPLAAVGVSLSTAALVLRPATD
jgi:uncharacterized membrane protein YoaK (UPF0700 family)